MMLWADLGLSNNAKLLSKEEQLHIYNEYMGKLEQECVADLTELFLEQSNLFGQIISSKENFDSHAVESVHKELKVSSIFYPIFSSLCLTLLLLTMFNFIYSLCLTPSTPYIYSLCLTPSTSYV